MIYRLLYKLLYDAADIRNRVATNIYASNVPAGVKGECIVMRRVSGSPNSYLESESDLATRMVQIDFYSKSATDAESGWELIRNAISGRGPENVQVLNSSGTESTIRLGAINLIRPGDEIDEPHDGSDQWSYRFSGDFEVFHSQNVPTHA